VAQLVLAWEMQRGLIVVPKSSNPTRILENLNAQKLVGKIAVADMKIIDQIGIDFNFPTCETAIQYKFSN
jgi:diketogulonate reductase-like aldo/keto reductase